MRKVLLASLLVAAPVWAAPVTVTWTNPTEYDDGSVLVSGDIASTSIEYSQGTSFGAVAGVHTATGSAVSATIERPPGNWCFRGRTTVVAAKGGKTSPNSLAYCMAVEWPAPKPPTLLGAIVAFLKQFFGRFV